MLRKLRLSAARAGWRLPGYLLAFALTISTEQ